jgi:HTH-type transcriptional regulator/antitoxin HigA
MNDIRPIRSARAHKAALAAIDKLLARDKRTKAEEDRLEVLSILVDAYEEKAFPMGGRDPIELLRGHMANSGRTQKDLADLIGAGLASMILSRRRAMSLEVIRRISEAWGIHTDLLTKPYDLAKKRA